MAMAEPVRIEAVIDRFLCLKGAAGFALDPSQKTAGSNKDTAHRNSPGSLLRS
jgi:hypothetical protein